MWMFILTAAEENNSRHGSDWTESGAVAQNPVSSLTRQGFWKFLCFPCK